MSMSIRIKEQRLENGYTQEELANKVGLKKSAIAKYENGRVENIKRTTILALADALHCSPSYLLDLDAEHAHEKENYTSSNLVCEESSIYNSYSCFSQNEIALIEKYRKSDNTTREMIHRLLSYEEAIEKLK